MNRTARIAVLGSAALLGVAALAGCSSSSSDSTASASAAASTAASSAASPAASASMPMDHEMTDEEMASMLPPVMVEENATTATAKVGDTIVFNVSKLAGTTIATDTPDMFELTQGGEKDGAEFNPGAKALKAGTGIITVTNPDASTRDVTITVTE